MATKTRPGGAAAAKVNLIETSIRASTAVMINSFRTVFSFSKWIVREPDAGMTHRIRGRTAPGSLHCRDRAGCRLRAGLCHQGDPSPLATENVEREWQHGVAQ